MDRQQQFWDAARQEMTATLATSEEGAVTMRLVSPVPYEGCILLFTAPGSIKYRQLRANPHCCLAVGPFFAQAQAEFRGGTMLPENEALRAAYSAKFPGAFQEGVEFGGRNAEFLLLRPTRLTGWAFPNGETAGTGIPSVPFDVSL